jgi:hypothetical protein
MGKGKKKKDKRGRPPEQQGGRPVTSMSPKQIRARARRAGKITQEQVESLYKPLDEWDAEELARGRPRAADGTWKGKAPAYISRELHERITERFRQVIRTSMNESTVTATTVLANLLENNERDEKGKYLVPPSTKAEIAKFLIEHVVGKPTQRIEGDISVKLQAILGAAIVNPDGSAAVGYVPQLGPGDDDDIEDAEIVGE